VDYNKECKARRRHICAEGLEKMGRSPILRKRVGRTSALRVPRSCLVYTPLNLATAMVAALGSSPSERWLEPCVGEGALLRALSRYGVKRRQIVGLDLEIDPRPLDKLATVSRGMEFISWSLTTESRFDKIIANPPYVAIERLQRSVKRAACRVAVSSKIRVTAGANSWYAFLCSAINLLRPSGSLCFVLPAAWDFADYASPLRSEIGQYFERVEIYRSFLPLFEAEGVQDGSVVLVGRGRRTVGSRKHVQVFRSEHRSAEDLIVKVASSNAARNRLRGDTRSSLCVPSLVTTPDTDCFGDLISLSIGGVTGDVDYFLLTDEERKNLRLPVASLRPVLSRARHLVAPEITTAIWYGLKEAGERVWLFHPPSAVSRRTSVKAYIAWGRKEGCDLTRQKILVRSPWYRTILPPPPDGFLSGMSKNGPWVCFRGMERLTATNTLYVVRFRRAECRDDKAAVALSLLTTRSEEQLSRICRIYADGLTKFEPGDLRNVRLQLSSGSRGAFAPYRSAVQCLLLGEIGHARSIADAWFSRTRIR
jgi:adenine-specific DNA-methyltransferase